MNFVPVLPEDRPRLDAVLRCVHRIAETIERDPDRFTHGRLVRDYPHRA